jgi:hypothetical protein
MHTCIFDGYLAPHALCLIFQQDIGCFDAGQERDLTGLLLSISGKPSGGWHCKKFYVSRHTYLRNVNVKFLSRIVKKNFCTLIGKDFRSMLCLETYHSAENFPYPDHICISGSPPMAPDSAGQDSLSLGQPHPTSDIQIKSAILQGKMITIYFGK